MKSRERSQARDFRPAVTPRTQHKGLLIPATGCGAAPAASAEAPIPQFVQQFTWGSQPGMVLRAHYLSMTMRLTDIL